MPVDRKWIEDRERDRLVGKGGAGGGGRLQQEPVYPKGVGVRGGRTPPQFGPQGKASRNVSAKLEERRAMLREKERERLSEHAPRAVSSPQVNTGPKESYLPFIGGGLG